MCHTVEDLSPGPITRNSAPGPRWGSAPRLPLPWIRLLFDSHLIAPSTISGSVQFNVLLNMRVSSGNVTTRTTSQNCAHKRLCRELFHLV